MATERYFKKLLSLQENFSVKIITGLRGTGKTALLKKFAARLQNDGVNSDEIIFIDFEEREDIRDFRRLYEVVSGKLSDSERMYLLFDNIQLVKDWEKAVNAFFVGSPAEIYLTGTSEGVMTGELKKILPDNIDIVQLFPAGVSDFPNGEEKFEDFINFGGLPEVLNFGGDKESLPKFLNGLYYEIVFKDIVAENMIRDAGLFDSLLRYLARNIGNPIKPAEIYKYALSINRSITTFTLENYLNIAETSGLVRRVRRYDIKNDTKLNGSERIYFVDNGILNAALNFSPDGQAKLIKNAVFMEFLRRGFDVKSGRLGTATVEFFATSGEEKIFAQVQTDENEKMRTTLLRPLKKLVNLKKSEKILLISLKSGKMRKGVEVIGIKDFLGR